MSPGNKSQLGRKAKCEDGRITASEGGEEKTTNNQKCVAKCKEVAKISTFETSSDSFSVF